MLIVILRKKAVGIVSSNGFLS